MTNPTDVDAFARALADPDERERLRRRHRDESKADLKRTHPTWLARALREESPAVRATVAARSSDRLAALIRADGAWPAPDRPPHPEVLSWVLSLWTERLVGGSDEADHPPVIVALTRTGAREAFRLWTTVGEGKASLASGARPLDWVERALGPPSPQVRALAERDVRLVGRAGSGRPRRDVALLGLVTAFRLLPGCDPHAVRWALQALPYAAVRLARTLTPPSRPSAPLTLLEGTLLRGAWRRLHAEGRLTPAYPAGHRP